MDNSNDMQRGGDFGEDLRGSVVAVLLAAGASTRFGQDNKLLAEVRGEPIIARVAGALLGSRVSEVVVVTPAETAAILTALDRRFGTASGRFRLIVNPDPGRGIGSSIATGIGAVPHSASGAMIVPGDMPGIRASACDALVDAFVASGKDAIVHAATFDGRQRNPVIWPRRLFASLFALKGDAGGKHAIADQRAAQPTSVIAVPFATPELFIDVDLPEDLERWK